MKNREQYINELIDKSVLGLLTDKEQETLDNELVDNIEAKELLAFSIDLKVGMTENEDKKRLLHIQALTEGIDVAPDYEKLEEAVRQEEELNKLESTLEKGTSVNTISTYYKYILSGLVIVAILGGVTKYSDFFDTIENSESKISTIIVNSDVEVPKVDDFGYPDNPKVQEAYNKYQNEQYQEAAVLFDELTNTLDDSTFYVYKGYTALHQNNIEDAYNIFNTTVNSDDNDGLAMQYSKLGLFYLYLMIGDIEQAELYLNELKQLYELDKSNFYIKYYLDKAIVEMDGFKLN